MSGGELFIVLVAAITGMAIGFFISKRFVENAREQFPDSTAGIAEKIMQDQSVLLGETHDHPLGSNPFTHIEELLCQLSLLNHTLLDILKDLKEGVIILDHSEAIRFINRSALKLLDKPGVSQFWIGKNIVELIRSPEVSGIIKEIKKNREAEISKNIHFGEKLFYVTFSKLKYGEGADYRIPERLSICILLEDRTTLNRYKDAGKELVANVAHELRTPLTSIKGYSETLLDGAYTNPELSKKFLKIIKKNADRVSSLVEDILTLALIEEKAGSNTTDEFDLPTLISDCIEMLRPVADSCNVRLEYNCQGQDMVVHGDHLAIELAIRNLIDNAIKYTRPGTTVNIDMTKNKDEEVIISVKDEGEGIPSNEYKRIFERFYRLNKERSRKKGGTGLGLSIVKEVAQNHQGRVWVESKWGEGSTFFMALPLDKNSQKAI